MGSGVGSWTDGEVGGIRNAAASSRDIYLRGGGGGGGGGAGGARPTARDRYIGRTAVSAAMSARDLRPEGAFGGKEAAE